MNVDGQEAKILVASHKTYVFPTSETYVPIQVGSSLNDSIRGIRHDNDGENISKKNGTFCELTALYWAWRNHFFSEVRYAGLVHYRRYFSGSMLFKGHTILSESDIVELLKNVDVLVPKRRRYWIETIYDHYAHAHYQKDLDSVREVLAELASEYLDAFDIIMQSRSLYLYNMFVMQTKYFDDYCSWLFPLLFEVEKRIDVSGYDEYQRRVFGFLAERLFNVWLQKNALKTSEVKVVNLEGENLFKKGVMMLKRKWFG